ncbi:hypothetical protein ED326_25255, partial [Escherichia coli]|nr:hypothetical protein [Escherichia coli]
GRFDVFAGKKSAQIREILISESAWEEMTCLFAPSLMNQGNMTKMDVLGLSILYLKSISSPLLGTGVLCHQD